MKTNIREYQTIKFFRGKERNSAEMQRLSDAEMDFEYRRLLIEENELDMHVAVSKAFVWEWLAWSFLVMSICFFKLPIVAFTIIGLAILFQIFSYINKRFFQFVLRSHNIALGFVDAAIFDKYGTSFK